MHYLLYERTNEALIFLIIKETAPDCMMVDDFLPPNYSALGQISQVAKIHLEAFMVSFCLEGSPFRHLVAFEEGSLGLFHFASFLQLLQRHHILHQKWIKDLHPFVGIFLWFGTP